MWVKCRGDGSLWFFLKLTFQHFSFPSTSSFKARLVFPSQNIQLGHFSHFQFFRLFLSPHFDLSSAFFFVPSYFLLTPSWTPSCALVGVGGCADLGNPGESVHKNIKKNNQKNNPATVLPGLRSTGQCMRGRGARGRRGPRSPSPTAGTCGCVRMPTIAKSTQNPVD